MNKESNNVCRIHSPCLSRKNIMAVTLCFCSLLGANAAFAQTAPAEERFPANARKFYAFGNLAAFNPDTNDQLNHQHSETANLIAGGGFRFSPLLSLELNYLAAEQRTDTPAAATPAPGTYADGTLKTYLNTQGLAASVKFNFPSGRIDPYFSVGAGRYSTRFLTTSEAAGCQRHCADTGPRTSRRSNDPGYHAALGADIHITAKDIISAELRYLRLKASFADIVPGSIYVGGTFLSVGYRRYF